MQQMTRAMQQIGTSTPLIIERMKEIAYERQQKFTIEMIRDWPALTTIDQQTYLGSFSWTMPGERNRLLYEACVVNWGAGPQTPSEVVRDYLTVKYPDRQRATTPQYNKIMKPRSFPRMALRGSYYDMAYIDLKSAYWSILLAVGWDVDYHPGKWIGVKSNTYDFPLPDNKPARSALVTAGLASAMRVWNHQTLNWRHGQNKHINYGLWALVQDVLHGVAHDMVLLGAVYVHTDGYIIPQDKIGPALQIIDGWGLRSGIKAQGDAIVHGVGVYRVGVHSTKRTKALPLENHVSIEPEYKDWLRDKFKFWSKRCTI